MSTDLISRQAAIDAIITLWADKPFGNPALSEIKECIDKLPSAEPEQRKQGFWCALEKGDRGYSAGDFRCSVCGTPNHTWMPKPKYCPECGSKMEVKK